MSDLADVVGYPSPPPPPERPDGSTPPTLAELCFGAWMRDQIVMIGGTSPRSLQARLGASEIGQRCERRISYRIAGTPVVNHPDPLRALLGTGFHAAMAEGFRRLDGGMNRYLVEERVEYRGIPGQVDLFDRVQRWLIDYKTTTLQNLRRYARNGVSPNYAVQAQIYAQGLIAAGEDVQTVALVFIPREAKTVGDIWCWSRPVDRSIADDAIDRYERIADKTARLGPAAVPAWPSNLCAYCPNYRPHAVDLAAMCPGDKEISS
jgi:hypothetical protein